jgi:hypothetical protein
VPEADTTVQKIHASTVCFGPIQHCNIPDCAKVFHRMPKSIVVTAADAGYVSFLRDRLESIRSCPELAKIELCVLDVGLDPSQREWLAAKKTRTLQPAWDIDVEKHPQRPQYYRAMTVRPFLPRYFPDYEIIAWLDADIWVQEPPGLLFYLLAAERYGFTITAEIDRSYSSVYGEFNQFRLFHHSVYYNCFGRPVADDLIHLSNHQQRCIRHAPRPSVLVPVAEHLPTGDGMSAAQAFGASRVNLAIYNAPPANRPHMLSATFNWICAASRPRWDPARQKLVEANLPHEPLALVHLTGIQNTEPVLTTWGSKSRRR